MAAPKKSGLGRGLDALFQDQVPVIEEEAKVIEDSDSLDAIKYLSIHDIKPNVNQPRKHFDEEKLEELSKSIIENGIIQPIVVRKKDGGFEIVAGERRWRASMKAGLEKVPCLIKELTDEQNMLLAIIENMQREDLNPIEEAEGLNQMVTTFKMTQDEVSKSVGKSRPYITNALRLLRLPDYIREHITNGTISAAHGRTLVAIESEEKQKMLCEKIVREGLSVRETEKLVSELSNPKKKPAKKAKDADLANVENELKQILGTKVNILQSGKKGKIEVEFYSKEERERLIDLLRSLN